MTRRNIIFPLNGTLPGGPLEIVMALNRALHLTGSHLMVESFTLKGNNGIATCSTTPSLSEVTLIRDTLIGLGSPWVEPSIPTSTSYLKVIDVPFKEYL